MYFDSQQLLTLFRGGQTVWFNEKDAADIDVKDNDWVELYNRNGVVASRVVISPRLPRGVVFMHHAQDRHHDEAHAHDRRLRAVQLRIQLLRPDGQPARYLRRRAQDEGGRLA